MYLREIKCIGILFLLFLGIKNNTLYAQVANITIDNPAPFGGNFGTVGGGAVYQSKIRTQDNADANAGFSLGLGNTEKFFGATVNFNIFGLSNSGGEDGNFGSGTLDLQINKSLTNRIFIGGGVRNLAKWRSPKLRARNVRSYYGTASTIIPLTRFYHRPFSMLFFTAGLGNGVFRAEEDFDFRTSGNLNFFGSAAIQVFRGYNLIVEWNGYDLNSGISIFPFKKIPALGATLSINDLTRYGPKDRFIIMVGYAFQFRNAIPTNVDRP